MVIRDFPSPEESDPQGLLGIGGDLEVETLLNAYAQGIFPWPLNDGTLAWFSPPERFLLFFDQFHVPERLKRLKRQQRYQITFNRACPEVIRQCRVARNRKRQSGTWITKAMEQAYCDLHAAGFCQSCEVWRENHLVGGVYGVSIGRMFAGESMFHREPNTSKIALCSLVEELARLGVRWLDCQVRTPLLEHFGARSIPRHDFLQLLGEAVGHPRLRLGQ